MTTSLPKRSGHHLQVVGHPKGVRYQKILDASRKILLVCQKPVGQKHMVPVVVVVVAVVAAAAGVVVIGVVGVVLGVVVGVVVVVGR